MVGRLAIIVLCGSILMEVSGCGPLGRPAEQPSAEELALSEDLYRAEARAQQTRRQFFQALQMPTPDQRAFAVQVGFSVDDGSEELLWLTSLHWQGQGINGTIADLPEATTMVAQGDRFFVWPDDITDWMYIDGDQLVGGYSIRLMYERGTEEDRQYTRECLGVEIPPVDF